MSINGGLSLEEEANRGAEALQLLANPLYKEAIAEVENGLIRSIKNSAIGDESTHHRLAIAMQLLGQITKHIEQVAQTGKMAEFQLKKDTMGQRLRKVAGL